jgi:hypothetical protein
MVTNSFGNKSFVQPMRRRLNIHSRGLQFFSFWRGREGIFLVSFYIPNVLPSCSHVIPQVPKLFLNMFPIAPQVYDIWFAQSSTPIYCSDENFKELVYWVFFVWSPWTFLYLIIFHISVVMCVRGRFHFMVQ